MLKLNASYSKKVPVPDAEFSSQSFHASIECECADALTTEQLQEKIHATFELVKTAVESELHGKPAAKSEPAAQPSRVETAKPDTTKASNKQVSYLLSLARTRGLTLSALNARVKDMYGAETVYDLARRDASKFVDELKAVA